LYLCETDKIFRSLRFRCEQGFSCIQLSFAHSRRPPTRITAAFHSRSSFYVACFWDAMWNQPNGLCVRSVGAPRAQPVASAAFWNVASFHATPSVCPSALSVRPFALHSTLRTASGPTFVSVTWHCFVSVSLLNFFSTKQRDAVKQLAYRISAWRWPSSGTLRSVVDWSFGRFYRVLHQGGDWGGRWEVGHFVPDCAAKHCATHSPSYLSPWEPEISPAHNLYLLCLTALYQLYVIYCHKWGGKELLCPSASRWLSGVRCGRLNHSAAVLWRHRGPGK
jgi:hypothetical protein